MLAARLGSGGQGVVYEAYTSDGTRVAVKVLRPDLAESAEARTQFAKEALAAQRVASFCTAKVLAVDPHASRPYIVSEFIAGPDLGTVVRSSGVFKGDGLLRLATGIATALTAIHQAGVVHRDLKPSNVLLGPDGPRVIDFGIARTPDMTLTETGAFKGTFGYIAPETLSGQRADTAADVFAWGALVLFAATGGEPFRGENILEVARKAVELEPELNVLPEALRPLVHDALAKRPEDRPSAATLLMHLLGGRRDDQQGILEEGASTAGAWSTPGCAAAATVPALGDVAEAAFQTLPSLVQAVAHSVWLRLVVPGSASDGSQDGVRTAREEELLSGRPDGEQAAVREVTAAFADTDVLVRERAGIRPASAAVLRAWPRLREWVNADREGLRVHRRVGEAARAWDQHGRRTDDLDRGTALHRALGWAATASGQLRPNLLEREFLNASRAADARRRRRRGALLAGTAVLVVVAMVASALAWQQNRANERQRLMAEARSLASVADSLRFQDPAAAMRLSVAAWHLADVTETRSALLGAMAQKEADYFSAPSDADASRPRLSNSGQTLVTYHNNHVLQWDVTRHHEVDSLAAPAMVNTNSSAVSADGRILAAPTWNDGGLATQLWRFPGPHRIGKPLAGTWEPDHGFSPSGHLLMLDNIDGNAFRLWDVERQRTVLEVHRPGGGIVDAAVSPDDHFVALYPIGGPLEIWDLNRQKRLPSDWAPRSPESQSENYTWNKIMFSSDSHTLTIVAGDTIRRWNIFSGRELVRLHHDSVQDADFSKDGKFLATAGSDEILLWRLAAPSRPVFRYPLTSESPEQVKVDSTARKIHYLTYDGRNASAHSLDLGRALDPSWRSAAVQDARFSADSHRLGMTWDKRHTVQFELRDGHNGKFISDLPDVPLTTFSWRVLSFSRDGRFFAYGAPAEDVSHATGVTVWDASKGRSIATLPRVGPKDPFAPAINAAALSPDGTTMAVSRVGVSGELWDVRRRTKRKELRNASGVMAFRPDGRLLVSSNAVSSLPSGKMLGLGPGAQTTQLAFSWDGKYLATSDDAGRVTLWDNTTRRQMGVLSGTFTGPRRGGTEAATALAFSRDGRTLAVGGTDGTLQLWDVASAHLLGSALTTPGDKLLSLAFSADGDTLYAAGAHVLYQRYPLDLQHTAEMVCKRAGRGLSRAEWRAYVHVTPYQETC